MKKKSTQAAAVCLNWQVQGWKKENEEKQTGLHRVIEN